MRTRRFPVRTGILTLPRARTLRMSPVGRRDPPTWRRSQQLQGLVSEKRGVALLFAVKSAGNDETGENIPRIGGLEGPSASPPGPSPSRVRAAQYLGSAS